MNRVNNHKLYELNCYTPIANDDFVVLKSLTPGGVELLTQRRMFSRVRSKH